MQRWGRKKGDPKELEMARSHYCLDVGSETKGRAKVHLSASDLNELIKVSFSERGDVDLPFLMYKNGKLVTWVGHMSGNARP